MQSANRAPITGNSGPIHYATAQPLKSPHWQPQHKGRKTTSDHSIDRTSKTSSTNALLQQIHNHAGEGDVFTKSKKLRGLMHTLGQNNRELL